MRKRTFILMSALVLGLGALAVAQDQGVQTVIGNVFLQDVTPGTAQAGHANITGTFRAGRVITPTGSITNVTASSVRSTSANGAVPAVSGTNTSSTLPAEGGLFTTTVPNGYALHAKGASSLGIAVLGEVPNDGVGLWGSAGTGGTGMVAFGG